MKGSHHSMLYGKFNVGEPVTVFANRGLLGARRLAKKITRPITDRANFIKDSLTICSYSRSQLDTYWRAEWSAWSAMKYSAYLKAKHSVARFPWYMKRHSQEPPDWKSAYMFCNMLAATSEMPFPRKKPPLAGGNPPSPSIESAYFDEVLRKIIVIINVHPLKHYDREFRVRLWNAGQYILQIFETIAKVIHLGPGPSPDQTKPVTIRIELEDIRVAGLRFNQEYLRFDDMAFGSIFFYADCVTAYSPEHGPLVSAYSNVGQVILPMRARYHTPGISGKPAKITFIPGMGLRPAALKLFKRIRQVKKKEKSKHLAASVYVEPKWRKKKNRIIEVKVNNG